MEFDKTLADVWTIWMSNSRQCLYRILGGIEVNRSGDMVDRVNLFITFCL
jgi:hypothetical protein